MDITIRDAQLTDTSAIVQLISDLAASSGETSLITDEYAARYLSSPTSKVMLTETSHGGDAECVVSIR